MPASLLIANRGEIARRIVRTAREHGVRSIVVHSPGDAELPFVREADEAIGIDDLPESQVYLAADRIVSAGMRCGAEAVHPGYGFLSERASFARAVQDAGMRWVGPSPAAIAAVGDKIEARRIVAEAGVPVGKGSGDSIDSPEAAMAEAEAIGYPLMLKASAGGGGMGMSVAHDQAELTTLFEATRSRAERLFGDSRVFLERFVEHARHVEVQIFGLADGTVVALGERDCSTQRRNQKVVEESPAPNLPGEVRDELLRAAVVAGRAVGYRNAGTVEFLVDAVTFELSFLEMNTRLQVEHPVTELVTGLDLVHEQLRVAMGGPPSVGLAARAPSGHAIEARVCAEDPVRFLPGPGHVTRWDEPAGEGIRVDSGYRRGNTVTADFDPLLAKLCAHGPTRDAAIGRLRTALDQFAIEGPKTNLEFLRRLVRDRRFADGRYDTGLVHAVQAAT
ncbi:biotin carboxylase [Amycolatopsis alkalitolerans]|uniref:Biotin carboxylase n=1 Tax=Amycolatopsis alkalitolerans TaxID=2547244 RepID=A0A5C4M0U3_9PSEU|nr:biotin carboxylase [Amycolatopsis alkalitolerans]